MRCRLALEEYFRITYVVSIALTIQTTIIALTLWEKSNGSFLVFDICQTLWFYFNTQTIFRLLKLKIKDQRRDWRREDDVTFTALRSDIENISESGIKFKDTYSNDSLSRKLSM